MDLAPRTRSILLPHGYVTLIDEVDWLAVKELTLYRGQTGYAYYSKWLNKRSVTDTLHSFLVGPHPGLDVDHINGVRLDNRRSNLRVVTHGANLRNRQRPNRNNRSGVRGVYWHARLKKWAVQIQIDNRTTHVGLFASLEEAARAREEAERLHY